MTGAEVDGPVTEEGSGREVDRPFVFGSGNIERTPLVLLAGMLGDASLWDEIALACNDIVRPCPIRIDLDSSIAELATSVLAQAPVQFVLAGHSLGGIVALEVQRRAPQRVLGLILLNSSGLAPTETQRAAWSAWRDRTAAGEFDEIVSELGRATLAVENLSLLERNTRMAATIGPDGFHRQLAAQSTRTDSVTRLAEISVPVLVFSGDQDEICPPARQRELVEACPGARLVEIAGAGHMLPLEAPAAVASELRGWLSSVAAAVG